MRKMDGVSQEIMRKMESLSKISGTKGMPEVDEFARQVLANEISTTKDDLQYIKAFLNAPNTNQFLNRMLPVVVGKLKTLEESAVISRASPSLQMPSTIEPVLMDCDALLKQIEEVMWLPHVPALRDVLDQKIAELDARADLTGPQKGEVDRLRACSEFWRLIHEVDDFRVDPHSGKYEKDAAIDPLKKLVELIKTPVVIDYLKDLSNPERNAFNVFEKKVLGIVDRIQQAGLAHARAEGEAARWQNVSDDGKRILRTLGQALQTIVRKKPEENYIKAMFTEIKLLNDPDKKNELLTIIYHQIYDSNNEIKLGKERFVKLYEGAYETYVTASPVLSVTKGMPSGSPTDTSSSQGSTASQQSSPSGSPLLASTEEKDPGSRRSGRKKNTSASSEQGTPQLIIKEPLKKSAGSVFDAMNTASDAVIVNRIRSAVDEYSKKNHVGQSSNSSILNTALTVALGRTDGMRSAIQEAFNEEGALKEGKSAFASILAKHGLAEHIPALLINRVKAVVSEYEASQKGLMSIFKTHGDQSKALVSALKGASAKKNPAEAKAAIEAAFIAHTDIGGRLGNILKENGLDEFAKKCQPQQTSTLTR